MSFASLNQRQLPQEYPSGEFFCARVLCKA
nr:MAG TPA: hypothetical protein [Caudoviricetes sp.]